MKITSTRGTYFNNRSYFRGQGRGQLPRAQGHHTSNNNRGRYQNNYNNYRNNAQRYQGYSRPFQYTPRGRGQYNHRGYTRRGGHNFHNNLFTIPQNANAQVSNSEQSNCNERVDQFFRNE